MEKYFSTAGPIKPNLHYFVDTKKRWNLQEVLHLIRQEKYFVLYAPRQTGKTSNLLSLVDYLNKSGAYEAIYANIEAAQAAREDVKTAMGVIAGQIASRHQFYLKNDLLTNNWERLFKKSAYQVITNLLTFWAENTDKPTVLFLDEVDALIGDTLISLLRQIRSGYDKRPNSFPISIILCGVRDIRDYRIHSSKTKEIITGGSAFNIKAASLRLENFTKKHIEDLYNQHTQATGQVFEKDVIDLVWYYTQGQPWLVNALAYEATFNMKENRDRTKVITSTILKEAKERLILRRDTHLDQLTDKLQEARIRRVIEPILSGKMINPTHRPDDVQYVRDLGLINVAQNGEISIANAIYQEIIPRELTWTMQTGMTTNYSIMKPKEILQEIDKVSTLIKNDAIKNGHDFYSIQIILCLELVKLEIQFLKEITNETLSALWEIWSMSSLVKYKHANKNDLYIKLNKLESYLKHYNANMYNADLPKNGFSKEAWLKYFNVAISNLLENKKNTA
jgi:type II secretory pathway predicted ATPase ExeA